MNEEIKDLIKITSRIEQKLDTTHEWVKSRDKDIQDLKGDLNRAKGGWFAMIGFTGLAGAIGGLVAKFWR